VRLVVAGSGTGVGKTHVAVSLILALHGRGILASGVKPVESGVASRFELGDDGARLAAASHTVVSRETSPPYRLEPALSPHLAALQAGVRIDLGRVRAWVASFAQPVIVETAGGLFSPLGSGSTNLDLVRALEPAMLILVAPDRLGVLHDVTASVGYARALGRPVDAVVLCAAAEPDASTGSNGIELERLGIARVAPAFPRAPVDAPETIDAANALLEILGAL
jgi:dethiobiotin synthetase